MAQRLPQGLLVGVLDFAAHGQAVGDAGAFHWLTLSIFNSLELSYEHRQVICQDFPENIHINGIVAMNQPMTKTDNLRPGNGGGFLSGVNGNLAGRLADNFQEPDQGQTENPVCIEVGARYTVN
jgi:hypothetical protein